MLSPALAFLVIALVSPFLLLAAYSFLDGAGSWQIGLSNYEAFFANQNYLRVLLRSIGVSSIVAVATVTLSYPAAYFIAFHGGRRKTVLLILVTLPFWTSYLLRVFSWKLILGYNGAINSGLLKLGIIEQPLEFLLYNLTAVVITLSHSWAAFAILPIYVSLQKIDRTLLEAANDLGEGAVATFLRVTLPLSLPGVMAAFFLVFIPTVGDYVTPSLVGGPKSIMIGSVIQMAFGGLDNWPLGAAISIVTMISVAMVVGVLYFAIDRLKAFFS